MPKIQLILSIICHCYFDTNHFITWFVYFLVCFGDNQLIPWGRGGLAVFVNKINNLATQSWNKMNCELMLTYDTPALRQAGSRNLTGQKMLPTIWGTYMKLVTKYQISAINSCWEKCAYMFNVYKNQQSRHTGSRNLTGPKTFSTIWHTYMKLVNKYQIPVINSCWEKCDEKCAYTNVC
jgi:hypothetical protein